MRYSQETSQYIPNELRTIIEHCNFLDDGSAQREIVSYLDHGEIEMSLEGMWIEAIAGNIKIPEAYIQRLLEYSKIMELDKESVFDNDIWKKIESFVSSE